MNAALRPINSTAARVVSVGTAYVPDKKVNGLEFANRPALRPITRFDRVNQGFKDVTGQKRGRLVAIGLLNEVGIRWVARCGCGVYVVRKAKAMVNPSNDADACAECLHVMYLKRNEQFRRTGKNALLRDFV